jgi:hypothetical protein
VPRSPQRVVSTKGMRTKALLGILEADTVCMAVAPTHKVAVIHGGQEGTKGFMK